MECNAMQCNSAQYQGRLNLGGMTHFASQEMLAGKLKDAATRCVLRPVDASKCVCGRCSAPGPAEGAYSAPPDPLAGFGEGKEEEEWKGLEMEKE